MNWRRAWKAFWYYLFRDYRPLGDEIEYHGWYIVTHVNISRGLRYKFRCGPKDEVFYHYVLRHYDDPPLYITCVSKKYEVGEGVRMFLEKEGNYEV